MRPLRFALAVAMAPVFDGFMNFVQHRFGCRKQTAFAGWDQRIYMLVPCHDLDDTRECRQEAHSCLLDCAVYIALLGVTTTMLVFGSIYAFAGPLAYSRTPPML